MPELRRLNQSDFDNELLRRYGEAVATVDEAQTLRFYVSGGSRLIASFPARQDLAPMQILESIGIGPCYRKLDVSLCSCKIGPYCAYIEVDEIGRAWRYNGNGTRIDWGALTLFLPGSRIDNPDYIAPDTTPDTHELQREVGVCFTAKGTPYFQKPQAKIVASTQFSRGSWDDGDAQIVDATLPFLHGFEPDLEFTDYWNQPPNENDSDAETLIQFAGQLCYLSLGPNGTRLANADRYIGHLIDAGHTSVLEHASVSVLAWGVSRSLTHELVRHRVGVAYSQVSQRYTAGPTLRFVEGPEFSGDPELRARFESKIDRAAAEYAELVEILYRKQEAADVAYAQTLTTKLTPDGIGEAVKSVLSDESKTARRKKVQGAARRELPNQTEAPILFTYNLRAWRHFFFMRATAAAEVEIRALAMVLFDQLRDYAPAVFADFEVINLYDGTQALRCAHVA